MGILFSSRKSPEKAIDRGLERIRDLYAEILNIERKVSTDVSVFFNYQHREERLSKDINRLEGLSRRERLQRGKEIMNREHRLLEHEKRMLDDIRTRLRRVIRLVEAQEKEIKGIERSL